jgi:hypothetical protein
MPLFEVALLQKPTKKEIEEGTGKEELLFGPKAVVARDSQGAAIAAVLDEDFEKSDIDMSRVEVLVRPFA